MHRRVATRRGWGGLAAVVLALGVAPPLLAQTVPTPLELEQAIGRALEDHNDARAARLLTEYLQRRPNDAQMLYNLACVYSRLGEIEQATGALYRAVEAGFRNFGQMQHDPDLEAIRDTEMYAAILQAARRAAAGGAEAAIRRWKQTYGEDGYRFAIDDKRRLAFAAALDETALAEMRAMLEQEADHLTSTLFDTPPGETILIAVPTPTHAATLFSDPSIGGRYEHSVRRLIARNIGGSLRHEFVHALHYAHMEHLGLRTPHPIWIQEGLAALYEDCVADPSGDVRFLPSKRTNIVRRLARSGGLTDWDDLFTMSAEAFMRRPGRLYAEARSIFRFLAEHGKLGAWYRTYVAHYHEDRTGQRAFEIVFGEPLKEVQRQWRQWAAHQPEVDVKIDIGDASLGIVSRLDGSNIGVLIDRVMPGSGASRGGLRGRDVIVAVDGQPTRSLAELHAVIGAKRIGDRVVLRVLRGREYVTATVTLRARPGPRW